MAEVTAALVKQLREMSGAGMIACKKALVQCDGDIDAAIDFLRKSGEAQAVKKAGRIAAEGLVMVEVEDGKGVAVEVNSETDFVAKNEKFQNFVKGVADQVLASDAADVEALLAEKWLADPSQTVKEVLVNMIATIGEKLDIRRFAKIDNGNLVVSYTHGGGRIGVLVEAEAENNEANVEALRNVAMQVAALNPRYVSEETVDAEFLAHEKEIIKTQAASDPSLANKPEKVIENILAGKLKKELKEICLLDQPYVKDDSMNVDKYLKSVGNIKVVSYVRFETGEGIEKRQENFAEEVAKQMQ